MSVRVLTGDARDVLQTLPDASVHMCVCSPPYYGLRDYGVPGQMGLEESPEAWVAEMVKVFREVRRVMRPEATAWINCGDSYAGSGKGPPGNFQSEAGCIGGGAKTHGLKPKDLIGIPWMLAFALRADGWYLRADIIWSKPNPMPESVQDRPTKAHEYLFLLSKSRTYYYDADAIREPLGPDGHEHVRAQNGGGSVESLAGHDYTRLGLGVMRSNPAGRNKRSVWTVATEAFSEWSETSRRVDVALGDVDGDTKRTPSPDCPLHASQDYPPARLPDDGRGGASAASLHSPGTYTDHASEQIAGHVPTGLTHAEDSSAYTLGLQLPLDADAAIPHSNGSHRTALVPATTRPYTPSAESPAYTPHTSASPGSADSADHIAENSTSGDASQGGRGSDPEAQTQPRNADSCTCSYYREYTEKTSHFATYPTALIEPCIKAGTSERGCCPECGAPWVRVVESEIVQVGKSTKGNVHVPNDHNWSDVSIAGRKAVTTVGWRASCGHAGEPVPATVLDPFAGAFTTALVAERLGRDSVMVEINPTYVEMGRKRVVGDAPMFTSVDVA